MSDNANSSGPATSLGAALYGPSGPAEAPQGPTPGMIDAGKPAAPPVPTGFPPTRPITTRAPAAAAPGARSGEPPATEEKSRLAQAFYGKSAEPGSDAPFDPANLKIDGFEPDPGLMTEFAGAAKNLGLSHAKAEQLLTLHTKAARAEQAAAATAWEAESRAHFGHRLDDTVSEIRDRIGSGPDAEQFMKLMASSGLGSNVVVLRTLAKLARGY